MEWRVFQKKTWKSGDACLNRKHKVSHLTCSVADVFLFKLKVTVLPFFESENQKRKQNQDDSDEDDDDDEAGPSFQQPAASAQPQAAYTPMTQPGMAPVPAPGMPHGSYSGVLCNS